MDETPPIDINTLKDTNSDPSTSSSTNNSDTSIISSINNSDISTPSSINNSEPTCIPLTVVAEQPLEILYLIMIIKPTSA